MFKNFIKTNQVEVSSNENKGYSAGYDNLGKNQEPLMKKALEYMSRVLNNTDEAILILYCYKKASGKKQTVDDKFAENYKKIIEKWISEIGTVGEVTCQETHAVRAYCLTRNKFLKLVFNQHQAKLIASSALHFIFSFEDRMILATEFLKILALQKDSVKSNVGINLEGLKYKKPISLFGLLNSWNPKEDPITEKQHLQVLTLAREVGKVLELKVEYKPKISEILGQVQEPLRTWWQENVYKKSAAGISKDNFDKIFTKN